MSRAIIIFHWKIIAGEEKEKNIVSYINWKEEEAFKSWVSRSLKLNET